MVGLLVSKPAAERIARSTWCGQCYGRGGRYGRYGRRHRTPPSRSHEPLSTPVHQVHQVHLPCPRHRLCAMCSANGACVTEKHFARGAWRGQRIGLVGPVGLFRRGTGHNRHAAMCRCPTCPTRPTASTPASAVRHVLCRRDRPSGPRLTVSGKRRSSRPALSAGSR